MNLISVKQHHPIEEIERQNYGPYQQESSKLTNMWDEEQVINIQDDVQNLRIE